MADKAWKDLTKEERGERIKRGQDAARARRGETKTEVSAETAKTSVDVQAIVAQEVLKALAIIRGSDTVTGKKDPKDMTPVELKAEHERLQAALEALPFVGDQIAGEPGTVIMSAGNPLTAEYVPYTQAWFLDIEARRKDRNKHNGQPAELRWPNYQLHDVVYQGTRPFETVVINGVSFGLVPGVVCKLPTPHYGVWMESIMGLRKHAEQFTPPTPSTNPGYFHVNISQSNGRPVAVLLGKGPLPSMAEREAQDVPVTP